MERVSISILSFLIGILIYNIVALNVHLTEVDKSLHELNVEMCKLVPDNEKCRSI